MSSVDADAIVAGERAHVVATYRRAPVVFVRGEGARLFDADGRSYLDLVSGLGVASLGHAHPGLAAALADQAATLLHTSNLYYHPLQAPLAARLATLSGLPRAFFCNSGTEAVEACLKFARRHWKTRGEGRTTLVALDGSFHGRTYGALSVTADERYRQPFAPLLPDVTFAAPEPAALEAAITRATAAVIVEPLQGEGGVRPLSAAAAGALREACRRTGALLIADEVQCGLGRTGRPFGFQPLGLEPDLVAIGKALGAGVPIGAALVSEEVAGSLSAGDHGSTYGGNPLACRAALYFLETLVDGGLLAQVGRTGAAFGRHLRALQERHPAIAEIRGEGLMRGLDLRTDAAAVVDEALRRGLLINRTAGTVIRLLPPLTISEAELDEGMARLDEALGAGGKAG